jgi:cytochrome c-type biogenesis protein CcmH
MPVWAQDEVTDDEVNRVAKTLYCPVCENQALDTCPTEACRQWRATIREQLEAGRTDEEIRQYFEAQYGERVLAAPRAEGFGLLMWVIPPTVVALGAALYWNFLRNSRRRAPLAAPAAPAGDTDDYAARLEVELKKRR